MAKRKISATVDPDILAEAVDVSGSDNVSKVIDRALRALIDLEKERRWLDVNGDSDLPGAVPPDLTGLPWDD